jgi:hypothetical protein
MPDTQGASNPYQEITNLVVAVLHPFTEIAQQQVTHTLDGVQLALREAKELMGGLSGLISDKHPEERLYELPTLPTSRVLEFAPMAIDLGCTALACQVRRVTKRPSVRAQSDEALKRQFKDEGFARLVEVVENRDAAAARARAERGLQTNLFRHTATGVLVGGFAQSLWTGGGRSRFGLVAGGLLAGLGSLDKSLEDFLERIRLSKEADKRGVILILQNLGISAGQIVDQAVALVHGAQVNFEALTEARTEAAGKLHEAAQRALERYLLIAVFDEAKSALLDAKNGGWAMRKEVPRLQAQLDEISAKLAETRPRTNEEEHRAAGGL